MAYSETYMCKCLSLFKHFFPVQIDVFLIFCQGEFNKQPKISHFVNFDWEKCIKMAWVAHIEGLICQSILATRCLYWGHRSPSWSANMSSNSRNLKLPFLTIRCLYKGVDLPLDLPIWALEVEIWNCHSWPLDASAGG